MVKVRPATPDDLDALAALAGKLVRFHHALDPQRFMCFDGIEDGYRWWFGKELTNDDVVLLVAEEDGASPAHLVGYAYGRIEERNYNELLDRCAKLHDIWVEDAARRGGVARSLMGEAIRRLEAKGAPRVVLLTASQNEAAQRLFASLGFRRTMIEMTREAG